MPYAFIDHQRFINDITAQIRMSSDPYVFPYTLQYVGTTPYVYYLKNIAIWGIGPFISLFSIIGIGCIVRSMKHEVRSKGGKALLLTSLFLLLYSFYFIVIGRSSVKFMRYMFPLYPFFVILAGYGFFQIRNSHSVIRKFFSYFLFLTSCFWTVMFMSIYSRPHTRIAATDWIIKNIPKGSTIAVEHWDDRLPLYDSEKYSFEELQLYNIPDDTNKWSIINNQLERTDYLIIASNRLYTPLQKLSDCSKYKLCYPKTAEYYKNLLQTTKQSQIIRFSKVAEFTSYPMLRVAGFELRIIDDSVDESFTVYDHPKIMIYKKNPKS
jgi:hypothetical protein